VKHAIQKLLLKRLIGDHEILLRNEVPSKEQIHDKFRKIDTYGLYLHIPFCEQICPYCPYNKELYRADLAREYTQAVKKEINSYAESVGDKAVTSFYIGGGTPTTMLHSGLRDIIDHIRCTLNLQCDIHMESHPNHLNTDNLNAIQSIGIQHLSIGVESLVDRHLKMLCRPYTVTGVREAVGRALAHGFKCVNVDVMFGLPGQTCREVEETGRALIKLGVDQVAAYPLFLFPYTQMGKSNPNRNHGPFQMLKRRHMMRILERVFYEAGYERTSTWAFTRRGVPRYCSVTVPLYLGLGASGGSYLKDVFYLNTFDAGEYIKSINEYGTAIALSLDLSERMQRAGWLYWRIYETRFNKNDYVKRFGEDIDSEYGRYFRFLEWLGFLKDDGERIVLSDRGSFWLHAGENIFSINYISKLWGMSKRESWPEHVSL